MTKGLIRKARVQCKSSFLGPSKQLLADGGGVVVKSYRGWYAEGKRGEKIFLEKKTLLLVGFASDSLFC